MDTLDILKPHVSDTARAAVAERFAYLPPDAAEVAAGYLTLIEEVDAKHELRANPNIDYATALEMGKRFEHLPPWKQDQMRREWTEEREAFIRPFTNFLALYYNVQPVRFLVKEKGPTPSKEPGQ